MVPRQAKGPLTAVGPCEAPGLRAAVRGVLVLRDAMRPIGAVSTLSFCHLAVPLILTKCRPCEAPQVAAHRLPRELIRRPETWHLLLLRRATSDCRREGVSACPRRRPGTQQSDGTGSAPPQGPRQPARVAWCSRSGAGRLLLTR